MNTSFIHSNQWNVRITTLLLLVTNSPSTILFFVFIKKHNSYSQKINEKITHLKMNEYTKYVRQLKCALLKFLPFIELVNIGVCSKAVAFIVS